MKIRWHLVLLVCSALLPVLIFVSVLTGLFWSQQRATLDQGYLEGVRGLTLALEAEISASVHTLQALALSPELDTQSPSRFSNTLSRVLNEQKRWSTIALVDSFGKRLFTVGKQPAKFDWLDRETLHRVLTEGQPVISGLVPLAEGEGYFTEVAVPVVRNGVVTHAFVVGIEPQVWLELLSKYPLAANATLTLLDQNGMIVARTLNNNRWLGKRPAPDLYTTSRQALEAAYRSIGLEGQRFYTAHRRSMQWGWTIATGVPRESVEHAMRGSVLTMIGGSLSAVSLALVLAFIFGRRISAPISAVAESAKALGAGSAVNLPSVRNIAEVSDVTRAFEEALYCCGIANRL